MGGVGNACNLNPKDLKNGVLVPNNKPSYEGAKGKVTTGGDLRTKGSFVKGSAPKKK